MASTFLMLLWTGPGVFKPIKNLSIQALLKLFWLTDHLKVDHEDEHLAQRWFRLALVEQVDYPQNPIHMLNWNVIFQLVLNIDIGFYLLF